MSMIDRRMFAYRMLRSVLYTARHAQHGGAKVRVFGDGRVMGAGEIRGTSGSVLTIEGGSRFLRRKSVAPSVVSIGKGGRIELGGNFLLMPGTRIEVGEDAICRLGGGTFINCDSFLYAKAGIEIGDTCVISWGVTIIDSDDHYIEEAGQFKPMTLSVSIGDRVWIGSGATVLKGVRIGEGAIVGANSTVTADIPPHCLAAGCPARVLKTDVKWYKRGEIEGSPRLAQMIPRESAP